MSGSQHLFLLRNTKKYFIIIWMDGTLANIHPFQSYQDSGREITKGCVQRVTFTGLEIYTLPLVFIQGSQDRSPASPVFRMRL